MFCKPIKMYINIYVIDINFLNKYHNKYLLHKILEGRDQIFSRQLKLMDDQI